MGVIKSEIKGDDTDVWERSMQMFILGVEIQYTKYRINIYTVM